MLTLYDDPLSRNGYKIRLLLSHLGLPVRLVRKDIMTGETRQPDFMAKNVAGRIPVLELEDGTCLAESNAILLYLADGTALLPTDRLARTEVLRWMFFEQNMIECTIGTARFFKKTGRDATRADVYAHRLENARDGLAAMDRQLSGRDWLAGAFSVADLALYGYCSVGAEAGIDMSVYPRVEAWLERVEARPGHVGPFQGFAA
ncbi:MAG TPA: glutathione S-transferase family protein [Candidatus Sulfotelmatobacter sp.]|jgi:glutathione S-transferase|nr:glutathione S-transferase family protein [Candidatus Sulfotelmatobacter sp.]